MSLLPQRKKSPGEIAKLRESLGIPGSSPGEDEASAPMAPAAASAKSTAPITPAHHESTAVPTPPAPQLAAIRHEPRPVHSLKHSERITAFPADEPIAVAVETATPPSQVPKLVRSLRKSERIPVLSATHPPEAPPDSNLPFHRHSDKELSEIRRREALAMMSPVANPRLAAAHPALLIPGYLLAVAGSACFFFYEFPMEATAGCAAAALLIAAYVLLRRPISRHHAAFIAVIALFVIVFGALHYFPQLQHAT